MIITKPSGNRYFGYGRRLYRTSGNPTGRLAIALAYARVHGGWIHKDVMNQVCKNVGYQRLPNSWFPGADRTHTLMERKGDLVRLSPMGYQYLEDMVAIARERAEK